MTILEHMRTIDPSYGEQAHQREFLITMERVDRANPCSKDHSATKPPCHTSKCYPTDRSGRVHGA